jgi:hypothetical protein
VFCRPVVTAPALPRRDGSVRADGWLPDFVRLGAHFFERLNIRITTQILGSQP